MVRTKGKGGGIMQVECKNCLYWFEMGKILNHGSDVIGQCRRHPPQIRQNDNGSFPHTAAGDWCGEYLVLWGSLKEAG